jgi:hypothetical protein
MSHEDERVNDAPMELETVPLEMCTLFKVLHRTAKVRNR